MDGNTYTIHPQNLVIVQNHKEILHGNVLAIGHTIIVLILHAVAWGTNIRGEVDDMKEKTLEQKAEVAAGLRGLPPHPDLITMWIDGYYTGRNDKLWELKSESTQIPNGPEPGRCRIYKKESLPMLGSLSEIDGLLYTVVLTGSDPNGTFFDVDFTKPYGK